MLCCRVKSRGGLVDEADPPYEPAVRFVMRRLPSRLFSESFQSNILDCEQASFVMMNLPSRYQFTTPRLLFRLSTDGISFSRFWSKIDEAEQSILIIRALSGEVFGAYCSASWTERRDSSERKKTKYFGTGESFVFRLDKQDVTNMPIVYPWAGHTQENAPEYFMSATEKLLIVGSGSGDAIRIEDQLNSGSTAFCTTFNSPSLVANGHFEIEELEVFEVTRI